MAWQDAYLPASFRLIPFFVDSHEYTGGRNAVSHEPPDANSAFAEDVGRKANGYRIQGHVLGDNYFFLRDAIINAMNEKAAGILIHPYLGTIDVQPQSFTINEDRTEGRICRFTLNFIEVGDPNSVFGFLDNISDFISGAFAFVSAAKNAFELAAKISGLPAYVVESALTLVDEALDSIETSLATIQTNAENLASIKEKIANFRANKQTLLSSDPATFADTFDTIISDMKDVSAEPEDDSTIDITSGKDDTLTVFDGVLDYTASKETEINSLTPTTSTRQAEQDLLNTINRLVRQLTISSLSDKSAEKSYVSINAALDQRERLSLLYEEQSNIDGIDDDLYQTLRDQLASVTNVIPNPGEILGTETTKTVLLPTPSLVLAYDLYGGIDREVEIVDRNRIKHPGFIHGEIEVLTDG